MPTKSADELENEATKRLLRFALSAALLGGAGRAATGVLRSANPTYEKVNVPKPLVIDMPYPVGQAPGTLPLPGKEKRLSGPPSPMNGLAAIKGAGFKETLQSLPLGESIYDALPTYQTPLGKPGETDPSKVPLTGLAYPLVGLGGLLGGYKLTDSVMRAADRRGARNELDAARREYQDAVLRRVAKSHLPAKEAAAPVVPDSDRAARTVRAATDALYDALHKSAQGPPPPTPPATPAATGEDSPHYGLRTLASLLWPGLAMGPEAARANMMVAGSVGALGAGAGYLYARDPEARDSLRKRVKTIEEANAAEIPAPVVGRLVPVHAPHAV